MNLASSSALIVGGSRGLGLAIAEALAQAGAKLTLVARDRAALDRAAQRLGSAVVAADATDDVKARELVGSFKPDIVVLSAGAVPPMAPIHAISWEDFTKTWEVDARAALAWLQAALNAPLPRGSRFVTISSGAAIGGSPMSGGYAGAKRMQWIATNYAAAHSEQAGLGVNFQTFVVGQMIAGAGVGDAGAGAYARRLGVSPAEFLQRFGKAVAPADVGEAVARLLSDPALEKPRAFRFSGDDGLTAIEPAA